MKHLFSARTIFVLTLFISSFSFAYAQTTESPSITLGGVAIMRSLSFGIEGEDVVALQNFLRTEGFFTYPASTGFFGPLTRDAVMAFQAANGVPAIGVVGPMTRMAITTVQLSKTPSTADTGTDTQNEEDSEDEDDKPRRSRGSRGPSRSSSSEADTTAPVISSVATSSVAQTSITVTWTTNEAANTQVEYGATSSYGSSSTLDATLATSHTVNLTGLTAATTYHYRARSADAAGNVAYSSDATFTTAEEEYEIGAVYFDGSTHLLLDSLAANPTPYIFTSFWIKEDASQDFGPTEYTTVFASSPGVDGAPLFQLAYPTSGFSYGAQNVEGGYLFNAAETGPVNTPDVWNHYIMAADLSSVTGDFVLKLYQNGVDITNDDTAAGATGDPGNITLDGLPFAIGDYGFDDPLYPFYEGDMADFYLTTENLFTAGEISPATIAKFRTAGGKPVDLGADGSTPTGTAPAIYLHHEDGEAASDFANNLGTGGDFDIEAGALTEASTSPSD